MKNKFYMKDVLERFQVGRDTVKYYEKQGLITGFRDSNGYRYYDYIAIKRMERVFWLISMGYSIEQIKLHLNGMMMKDELKLTEKRIQELELKIIELKAQLELNKSMYRYCKDIPECYRHYQVKEDFEMCLKCMNPKRDKKMLSEVRVLQLDEEFSIIDEKMYESAVVQQVMRFNNYCENCDSNQIIKGKVVHGILKMSEMNKFSELLSSVQSDVGEEYILSDKAYCLYSYYSDVKPREEGVAVEFYIPITKREEKS